MSPRNYFIRCTGTSRAIGTTQQDALQGHEHTYVRPGAGSNYNGSGSDVKFGSSTTSAVVTKSAYGTVRIDAETRPVNIAMNYCIKY